MVYNDPHVAKLRLDFGEELSSVELTDNELREADCAVVVTAHSAYEWERFVVGDVCDPTSVGRAVRSMDCIINAAALKHVSACEYFPQEAVRTNVDGFENLAGGGSLL